ncbi:MAG TPA: S8 family serine peptidase [Candidatus Solibacter sp.]|nr:S8 family serine peptidase [Candidatus Solibacter sp.]
MLTRKPRLLVKSQPVPAGTPFAISGASLNLQPLFPDEHQRASLAAAPEPQWHIAEAPEGADEAHAWDLCHKLHRDGFGIAGAGNVEFAEPDVVQQWPIESVTRQTARAFAAADACAAPQQPNTSYPRPDKPDWRWYQGDSFSGLDTARSQIQNPQNRVTIAHLDTGYRQGHRVLPQFLDTTRQRNFVDADRPNDASDPGNEGGNAGHGTGTISILAGASFNGAPFGAPSGVVGGAPFATVIPLRVANSVVLFTNSAIAQAISYAIAQKVDVLSMSMGGVPSQVWVDVVNKAYQEAGIVMVTAAGNNFGPGAIRVPRFIVYPARFRRVLAACGVMFDGNPYADFTNPTLMGGSYGPDSKMDTAMAAYTPNVAWAEYACTDLIAFDGAGTSAATPQVAAAAACWLQKNRGNLKYSKPWMRVEAVRQALFATANNTNREHFGRGTLRAGLAMGQAPAAENQLALTTKDSISVPILGPIFQDIFGAAPSPTQQQMLHVEAAQILARNGELQRILAEANIDPDAPSEAAPDDARRRFLQALADSGSASNALKSAIRRSSTVHTGGGPKPAPPPDAGAAPSSRHPAAPTKAETVTIAPPLSRKIRVYAFDPILGTRVDTESINETTLEVQWEPNLQAGPVGEYIEVVDVDPASGACYAPVDLNHPHLLATNGLDPAEGVPQFHQQMVYAVAMSTIERFENALGRSALWAPNITRTDGKVRSCYVQRLRIYPHALREQNAYYSPPRKSLLFGYFTANRDNAGDNLPGGLVFSCLSHDVVAHETTHALLDGVHRHYQYQTNNDIAAFHEAFADIVALFQHFTIPVALRHSIAVSQGDLRKDGLLAQLAQQFGQASNGSKALRSALAKPPHASDYENATEAHDRGAVLLSAIFQAFLEIYEARVVDLKRLATGGSGVLPTGAIPEPLVHRMAREAATTADHLLKTCIRALDYCPPVDLTFGDYLRALITADLDLNPEDEFNYRTALISGFRARGIFPQDVRTLSEKNLRWQPPVTQLPPSKIEQMLKALDLTWSLSSNRMHSYLRAENNGRLLWQWFQSKLSPTETAALESDLGVYIRPGPHVPPQVPTHADDKVPILAINSVRPARRVNLRGQQSIDIVVELIQKYNERDPSTGDINTHRGGCTLLIDMEQQSFRYAVRKRVGSPSRVAAEQDFLRMTAENSSAYFDSDTDEPFAMAHRSV